MVMADILRNNDCGGTGPKLAVMVVSCMSGTIALHWDHAHSAANPQCAVVRTCTRRMGCYSTTAFALSANSSIGKITGFKATLRPLKAINLIHQRMGAMLQADTGIGKDCSLRAAPEAV